MSLVRKKSAQQTIANIQMKKRGDEYKRHYHARAQFEPEFVHIKGVFDDYPTLTNTDKTAKKMAKFSNIKLRSQNAEPLQIIKRQLHTIVIDKHGL